MLKTPCDDNIITSSNLLTSGYKEGQDVTKPDSKSRDLLNVHNSYPHGSKISAWHFPEVIQSILGNKTKL